MLEVILSIVGLLLAFPAGYLLAWLCRDELIIGRKWFKIIIGLSLIFSVIVSFLNFKEKWAVILSLLFLAIISGVSLWKSCDKKFIQN